VHNAVSGRAELCQCCKCSCPLSLSGVNTHILQIHEGPPEIIESIARESSVQTNKWLLTRADDLSKARVSLEYAKAAMVRAHKKGVILHVYKAGDQVKVTTAHLSVRGSSSLSSKLMPRFVGPFRVLEQVNPGAYRLDLRPMSLFMMSSMNLLWDWFNREDSRTLSDELPPVLAHPALNKVVHVLDRKRYKRAPKSCHVLDIWA
jgi:hypothetical protein